MKRYSKDFFNKRLLRPWAALLLTGSLLLCGGGGITSLAGSTSPWFPGMKAGPGVFGSTTADTACGWSGSGSTFTGGPSGFAGASVSTSASTSSSGGQPGVLNPVDYGWSSSTVTSRKVIANTYTSIGWQSDGGGRWYLDQDGSYPVSTWREINGKFYHFNEQGYMDWNRWIRENNGKLYFTTADGSMARGWNNVSEQWFYMDPANGQLYGAGEHVIDGKVYFMLESGASLRSGWNAGHYYDADGVRTN